MPHLTRRRYLTALFRKTVLLATMGIGAYYLYLGLDLLPQKPLPTTDSQIEVIFTEQSEEESQQLELSFEEYCRRNPVSTCFDYSQPADFLYEEDSGVAVIETEEFAPQLLEQAMQQEQVSASQTPDEPEVEPNSSEEPNPAQLEQMYEEPLPEDVLDISAIVNPKLRDKQLIPEHKPPYFGVRPVIAIVIDDMGISPARTADIASLQAPLTVSFLTYGKNLERQIENSRRAGQEIMIHVPMEAQSTKDAAPDVLTTRMTPDEIQDNLRLMLGKFHNVKGVNNHMGSRLTEDKTRMLAVMEVLKQAGLFFLDSKTSAASKAEEAAAESGLAYAHRHVFIDNTNDKAYILGQLAKAETVAQRNGYAIAIGHPKTQTFAALQEWLPQLEEKRLELVPLSKIIEALNPRAAD